MSQKITPQQAYSWLENGDAFLLDVREADEYTKSHIAYGVSLPLSMLRKGFDALSISREQKIIIHCHSGQRAEMACELLGDKAECPVLYQIEGGIAAWEKENLPLIKSEARMPLSIFRQVQIIVGGLVAVCVLLGFMGVGSAFAVAGFLGAALCFAGVTGFCGLAILLSKMPWNKG